MAVVFGAAVLAGRAQILPLTTVFGSFAVVDSASQMENYGVANMSGHSTWNPASGLYLATYAISQSADDDVWRGGLIIPPHTVVPPAFSDSYSFTATNAGTCVITLTMPNSYRVNSTDTGITASTSWNVVWTMGSNSSVAGPSADTYTASANGGSFSGALVSGLVGSALSAGSPGMSAANTGSSASGASVGIPVNFTPGVLGYGGTYVETCFITTTTWSVSGSANAATSGDTCTTSITGTLSFACTTCTVSGTHT